MSEAPIPNPGLWELAVLSLLRERPMHPYEILRLLKERHKDDVLVLKRGSLYNAIRRLQEARLIEVVDTTREGRRPERTIYRLTPVGERGLREWLRTMIAVPRQERSDFMGAVSFLVHLTPEDAVAELRRRAGRLEAEVTALDASIAAAGPLFGRINVIEYEYLRAMRAAELAWVREILEELRSGRLTWDFETIRQYLQRQLSEED
jgi:DNA-binding PadR family transcriptional regulator